MYEHSYYFLNEGGFLTATECLTQQDLIIHISARQALVYHWFKQWLVILRRQAITWTNKYLSWNCHHEHFNEITSMHYCDVIMGLMAYQITSFMIVYWTVYSGADQRKHQSSASLAFVRRIHRWPVNSPHNGASNAENVSIWWRNHGKNTDCQLSHCHLVT